MVLLGRPLDFYRAIDRLPAWHCIPSAPPLSYRTPVRSSVLVSAVQVLGASVFLLSSRRIFHNPISHPAASIFSTFHRNLLQICHIFEIDAMG
ncbi:hypothetical protein BDM02DRAFT_3122469 [Thelephora ganbajun]|uniref:Uncharacterized protein n=1 Tax=Thelephora ganbajun TaxID=370292 RepID=A0ACB6Z480_THEGA|nr:hypothetical protein BDM02DRAFT_3122469 [Thelephora ganbajun]